MITLTDHLLATAPYLDRVFRDAIDDARAGDKPHWAYEVLAEVRTHHGFENRPAPLLTPPLGNHKLAGASVPSYGLTLSHFRSVLPARNGHRKLSVNACPNAGHCVKVCVLNNGHGGRPSVIRGREWKTDLLAREPGVFVYVLAWELTQAVAKHDGQILFRPNVNSDVAWHRVLPYLTNGGVPGVISYGYSKLPETLDSDGWLGSTYRVAYSWNETSDAAAVYDFLNRGGSVAVVTSRPKRAPVLHAFLNHNAVDADKTDEWMFQSGVVGDLSAKGKARKLIGKSKFIVQGDRP